MKVCVGVLLVALLLTAGAVSAQLRQGQKLPSGPPKYYLRDGSAQMICAPYQADGKTAWSCAETATVIALILKEPPECGDAK